MLASQSAYVSYLKAGRQPGMLEEAKKVDKQSHATLNAIRAKPCNATCFDCTAMKPGWAVLPHGVFICMDCAQIHRHIGRHVSQTKAVNTGTYVWFPPEIAVMEEVGNARAEKAFAACNLPPKPSRDATPEEKMAYARRKYDGPIKPSWVAPTASADEAAPGALQATTPAATPMLTTTKKVVSVRAPSLSGAKRAVDAPPPSAVPPSRPTSPVNLIDFADEPLGILGTPPRGVAPIPTATPCSDEAFFAQFGL